MAASTTVAFALHHGLSKLSEAVSEAGESLGSMWGADEVKTYIPFDEVEGLKLPDLNPPESELVFNVRAGSEGTLNDQEFF